MRLELISFMCLAFALTGCGTDRITRPLALPDQNADLICPCPEAVGQPSEAECRAFFEELRPSEDEEACLRRTYSAYSAELDPVLDCQYEATMRLQDCMRPLLSSCPPDPAEASACSTAFTEETEACPMASEQAQAEFSACFASRT